MPHCRKDAAFAAVVVVLMALWGYISIITPTSILREQGHLLVTNPIVPDGMLDLQETVPSPQVPPDRFLLLSSVSSSIQWSLPDCNEPMRRATGIIDAVNSMPDIDYVIIAEDCEPKNLTDRIRQVSTLLPQFPGGGSKDTWASKGKFLGYRFLEFLQYLEENPQYSWVAMMDAFDVNIYAHPFLAMRQLVEYDLFIQAEWRTHAQSRYMMERLEACLKPDMYAEWVHKVILNCGVWGGRRADVIALLTIMKDMYADLIAGHLGALPCFELGSDMAVFNHGLYVILPAEKRARIKLNEPLTHVYRNCQFDYYVYGPRNAVNTSQVPCTGTQPEMIDAALDMSGGDGFVTGVCLGGGARETRCPSLPFAAVHKSTIVFLDNPKR